MKLLAMLVVVAIIALAIWGTALLIQKAVRYVRQRQNRHERWEVVEDGRKPGKITYSLVRPGNKQRLELPYEVSLFQSDYDFDEALTEARLRAENQAEAMNRKVK